MKKTYILHTELLSKVTDTLYHKTLCDMILADTVTYKLFHIIMLFDIMRNSSERNTIENFLKGFFYNEYKVIDKCIKDNIASGQPMNVFQICVRAYTLLYPKLKINQITNAVKNTFDNMGMPLTLTLGIKELIPNQKINVPTNKKLLLNS